MQGKIIFITGGAGYVGEMLCDQFAKRADVAKVITIDKEPQSEFSKAIPKLTYIHSNLTDPAWQEVVMHHAPDTVIHTAWQIRALYGEAATQWHWNVNGSKRVFDFALLAPSVKTLIYFSTAASYSARTDNTTDHYFTEAEGFRPDEYIYAHEKKVTEENLKRTYDELQVAGKSMPRVVVLRPAAITGPRGRYQRMRFGLQSALSGNLKGNVLYRVVTGLTAYMPATKGWVRQFIHEDDVSDIVQHFTFQVAPQPYEVYNITPLGELVFAADMAKAVGKRVLPIYPWMARVAFFFFWHATRGKVPTCPGSWRFYSYPIVMSGEKLATIYQCAYTSKAALRYTSGRYEAYVPTELRRNQ